jgi:polysaccharide pyruvyl transferase WcaK-like protein
LAAAVPGSRYLPDQLTVEQVLRVMAGSEVVVGMRLHALIMAAICSRPMVGIGYDPKVTGFLNDLAQPLAGMTSDLQAGNLVRLVRQVHAGQEAVIKDLQTRLPKLRQLAALNTEIAVALAGRRER